MFSRHDQLQGYNDELFAMMDVEDRRQEDHIELIVSENYASKWVMQVWGSGLTNKCAEDCPGKRYYGGREYVDKIERLAIDYVRQLLGTDYASVQPYSGSSVNATVYLALPNAGDTIPGISLAHGGHLTHGTKVSSSGELYNVVQYGSDTTTGLIDYDEAERLAVECKPKMIAAGFSVYSKTLDFPRLHAIADKAGALLFADVAHVAGLVAAGLYPNSIPFAGTITATTHKTLRDPRGGLILAHANEEIGRRLNSTVLPDAWGGPLMHVITAKTVCFEKALGPGFKDYRTQMVRNVKVMAKVFIEHGCDVVSGGTDNHLMLISLVKWGLTGKAADTALEVAHITTSKDAVPSDPQSPFITPGTRIDTPAVATRGFHEGKCHELADQICDIFDDINNLEADERVKGQVDEFCRHFPVYANRIETSPW